MEGTRLAVPNEINSVQKTENESVDDEPGDCMLENDLYALKAACKLPDGKYSNDFDGRVHNRASANQCESSPSSACSPGQSSSKRREPKAVEIARVSPEGEALAEEGWHYYPSIASAARAAGVTPNRVSHMCSSNVPHLRLGLRFRWHHEGALALSGVAVNEKDEPEAASQESDVVSTNTQHQHLGSPAEQQNLTSSTGASAEPEVKKARVDGKPIEARFEGQLAPLVRAGADVVALGLVPPEGMDWEWFPSMSASSRCTGAPTGSIAALCDAQGTYSGWRFRWPGKDLELMTISALSPKDLEALAGHIREVSDEDSRRAILAGLPSQTRQQLGQHLRECQELAAHSQVGGPGNSRLDIFLDRFPELLSAASGDQREKLLEGMRVFQATYCAVLSAASVADIAAILREVPKEQRKALMDRLPDETNQALVKYLTAEKNKATSQKGAKPDAGSTSA